MSDDDLSFLETDDPESLPPEERRKYSDYWFAKSLHDRLREIMRLNRAKWGDEVFDRGMDKSKLEVVDMKTGKILKVIYNTKNK